MDSYLIKWKGKQEGPLALDEIQRRFEDREIGPMHEIAVDGEWVTLRSFFRQRARRPAPETAPPGPSTHPPEEPQSQMKVSSPVPRPAPPVSQFTPPPQQIPENPGSDLMNEVSGTHDPSHLYGGFWIRGTAMAIDLTLVFVAVPWILDLFLEEKLMTIGWISANPGPVLGVLGIELLAYWIYSAACEGSKLRGTLGKRWVGLSVVTASGSQITFLQGFVRFFWKLVSGALLGTGFFLAAFSRQKMSLHDFLSDTRVLQRIQPENLFIPKPHQPEL